MDFDISDSIWFSAAVFTYWSGTHKPKNNS